MILHDWKCPVHGFFESGKPVCPHGCDIGIQKVFLQAPSIGTGLVQHMDQQMNKLTQQFGMTDLKGGVREGEAQKSIDTGSLAPQWKSFGQSALSGLRRGDGINMQAFDQASGGSRGIVNRTTIVHRADE